MLLCSSRIPISNKFTKEDLISLAIKWVTTSKNYDFVPFTWDGSKDFTCRGKNSELFQIGIFDEQNVCAIHFHNIDNRSIKWTTDFILDYVNNIFAFQLYRDAPVDIDYVPREFHLPKLVKDIISAGYSVTDNGLDVTDKPIVIFDEDIDNIANMMLRNVTYSMPIVYMSCETDGHCVVNPNMLAEKLNGVAHVIFETSRSISYSLRDKTAGINPYAGAIEIYYPNGSRRFLPSQLSGTHSNKVYTIVNTVFEHLNQLRVEDKFSWSQLQANKLRKQLTSSIQKIEQNTKEYEEFEHLYENLLKEKESEIRKLSDQLLSANNTISQLEAQLSTVNRIPVLAVGEEQDLYPFEQQSILVEILEKELRNLVNKSRKYHILCSLIEANKCENTAAEKRKRIKNCLHGYTKMSSTIYKELEAIGFTLSEDGKHIKLVFAEDPRYIGTLSKTGSDYRAGDNIAHDLIRLIF